LVERINSDLPYEL